MDPKILSQELIAKSIQRRMQDMATSVREAAVDLIGKFILTRPEVAEQYYKMLTERILDTGLDSNHIKRTENDPVCSRKFWSEIF